MKKFRNDNGAELERLFAGKAPTVDGGLEGVARMVDSVKSAYLSDPDPELEATHLTGLMRIVHLNDKGDLAARSASKVDGPGSQVSGLPRRRRKFMLETLFGTLAAKIAAGGIAVAMASTSAVAATGNLPDQMQTGISQAVDNVGISIPLGETAALERAALEERLDADVEADVEADVDSEADVNEVEGVDPIEDAGQPNENAAFGQSVAEDAQDGGVDGQQISDRARQMAEERKAAGQSHRPRATPEAGADATDAGSQRSSGLERAKDTPAANFLPGNTAGGPDTAEQRKPAGTPGGRP